MNRPMTLAMGLAAALGLLAAWTAAGQGQDRGRQDRRQQQQQQQQRRQQPEPGALRVGQMAPTFTLKSLAGESSFDLKAFRGEKPVVIYFGSYT